MSKGVSVFGAGLVAGAIIAWAAGNGCGPDLSRREASRDSLRTAVTALRDSQTVRAQRDRVTITRLTAALAVARPRVSLARAATDTLLVTVPDTVLVLVTAERVAADTVIARADSVIAALTAQISYWRDTAVVQTRGQLDRAQALLDAALRVRPRRCGLGAAAGYTVSSAGAGLGLSVGVACRL